MSAPLKMKSPITMENVARYVVEEIIVDTPLERRLREETMELPNGGMISSSDVGTLLALLAQSVGTKRAIEIGTFTGYTALKVALALPEDGRLICCDVNEEWTAIAKRYWEEAKVSPKIDLRLASANQTIEKLLADSGEGRFDFAFIDADKLGYDVYYENCLRLVRSGGIIVLDNMLRGGKVADKSVDDKTTVFIRELNRKISQDQRVHADLLTVGDGLMVVRKK